MPYRQAERMAQSAQLVAACAIVLSLLGSLVVWQLNTTQLDQACRDRKFISTALASVLEARIKGGVTEPAVREQFIHTAHALRKVHC